MYNCGKSWWNPPSRCVYLYQSILCSSGRWKGSLCVWLQQQDGGGVPLSRGGQRSGPSGSRHCHAGQLWPSGWTLIKFEHCFFSFLSIHFNIVWPHQVTLPPLRLLSTPGPAHCSCSAKAGVPITADRGQRRSDHREPAHVLLPACGHCFSWLHHSGLPSGGFFSQGSKGCCWLDSPRVTVQHRVQWFWCCHLDSSFLFFHKQEVVRYTQDLQKEAQI